MDFVVMGGPGVNTQSFAGLVTIPISACRPVGRLSSPLSYLAAAHLGAVNIVTESGLWLIGLGFKLGHCLALITLAGEAVEAT